MKSVYSAKWLTQIKVLLSTWLYYDEQKTSFHKQYVYRLYQWQILTGYIFASYWYILGASGSFAAFWR